MKIRFQMTPAELEIAVRGMREYLGDHNEGVGCDPMDCVATNFVADHEGGASDNAYYEFDELDLATLSWGLNDLAVDQEEAGDSPARALHERIEAFEVTF